MRQEIWRALRIFRDHRAFTLAAVVTVGLGTGATAAVFSVVYGVLLRPLPYPAADRLVACRSSIPVQSHRSAAPG